MAGVSTDQLEKTFHARLRVHRDAPVGDDRRRPGRARSERGSASAGTSSGRSLRSCGKAARSAILTTSCLDCAAPCGTPRARAGRAELDLPPRSGPRAPGARRVLLVSHNLNLEGAPIFLHLLARGLRRGGHELHLASMADGPLRHRYLADGVPVTIVDALGGIRRLPAYETRMGRLGDSMRAAASTSSSPTPCPPSGPSTWLAARESRRSGPSTRARAGRSTSATCPPRCGPRSTTR